MTLAATVNGLPFRPVPPAVSLFAPQSAILGVRTNTPFGPATAVPTTLPLSITVTVVPGAKPPAVNVSVAPRATRDEPTDGGGTVGPGYSAASAGPAVVM